MRQREKASMLCVLYGIKEEWIVMYIIIIIIHCIVNVTVVLNWIFGHSAPMQVVIQDHHHHH